MSKSYCIECPRKVILFGEHAVLYGKVAIAAAIGSYEQIMVDVTDGLPPSFHVTDFLSEDTFWNAEQLSRLTEELNSVQKSDPLNPKPPSQDAMGVVWKAVGANLESPTRGELLKVGALYLWCSIVDPSKEVGAVKCILKPEPGWAGLGTSAAYSVALSAALLIITGHIKLPLTNEGRKLASDWAYCCEHFFHGSPSGLDNTVCAFGGMVRFRKDGPFMLEQFPGEWRALLVSDEPKSTKEMIKKVAAFRQQHPQVVDAIFDAIDSVAKRASSVIDVLLETPGDLEHCKRLEELVDENHGLLQSLKVSTPKLDEICEIARQHGLRGKLTGAGGGGCAFVLLHRGVTKEQEVAFERTLRSHHFSCHPVELGTHGLKVHVT